MRQLLRLLTFLVLLSFNVLHLLADGTRNYVNVTDTIGSSGYNNEGSLCLFNAADGNGMLGTVEANASERFYIHIDDPVNEKIYLGFNIGYQAGVSKYFRVKAPDGTVVYSYSSIPTSGAGYISSYKSIYEGPSPTVSSGGYTPIIITPDINQSGDYYIEFNTTNSGDVMSPSPASHQQTTIFKFFDFSVGTSSASPSGQKTHDLVEGRFFAYTIPMYNFYDHLGLNYDGVNVDYYIYHTTDQVTTKLHWEKVIGGGWNILFNSTGPGNTGVIANDRKSSENASLTPTGDHRVFFGPPDESIYPFTTITPDFEFEDYRIDCETGDYAFFFNINRPGRLEMLLEFGTPNNEYDPNTTDRLLFVEDVTLNRNKVNWDGKDGLGNDADTAAFTLKMVFSIGATNNPMFDVEQVVGGLTVELISPAPSMFGWAEKAKLYYDDTQISGLGDYDYIGCSEDCHVFSGSNYGDRNWMNTWWTAYEETVVEVVTQGPGPGVIPIDSIYGIDPSSCSGTDGSAVIEGLVGGNTYNVSYQKNYVTYGPSSYTADGSGKITIPNIGNGTYNDFTVYQGTCGSPADFSFVMSCLLANDSILSCTENPGGSTEITVPGSYFTGEPYLGSTINKISFDLFPINADAITIGGTTYTAATFGSGVEINANANGNPLQTISIDPMDDVNIVEIYFSLKDDVGNVSNTGIIKVPFPNMAISSYVTDGTCSTSDGAISINVTGGNEPYTYLWTPGNMTSEDISNLAVGTYIVEVTDFGGCTIKDTFHVQANPITGICNISEDTPPSTGASTSVIGGMSGIITSTSGSGMPWSNPGRVYANDGSNARVNDFDGNSGNPMESDVLEITGFDFSSIPSSATIDGIELNIERYRQSGSSRSEISDLEVYLLKGGISTAENKASSSNWPTSAGVASYGGSTDDLWGETWSVTDIQNSNFGVRLQIGATGGTWKTDTYIDYVELIVYYTTPEEVYDDASSYTFSTALFNQATEYIWSSPSGATVISGQGTATATFDFSNLGAGIYQICVTPRNECDVAETCCKYIEVVDSAGTLTINGNVFEDNDGSQDPNMVDGYGIDSLSGNPIYAYLVTRSDNLSVDLDTVKADGSFRFIDNVLADTDYKVLVSTDYFPIGVEPSASLPANWYFAGEIDNNFENTLSGNDEEGNTNQDGETNGELWIESRLTTNSESNLNFGVIFAYGDGNTISCPIDSALEGCNPALPPVGTPTYTNGPWWVRTSTGSDYPGTEEQVSGCDYMSTVDYWAEWKIFGIIGSYTDTCSQVFTYMMDTLPPTATAPSDTIVACHSSIPMADSLLITDEADNCTATPTVVFWNEVDNGGQGNLDSPFIITRTYRVSDSCGNYADLVQTISVIDSLVPVINCPNDTIFESPIGQDFVIGVTIDTATALDNCGVDSLYSTIPDTFYVGTTEIYWYALDVNNNLDSCLQRVFVNGIYTDSVTQISTNTATLYGNVLGGNDIVEFGFYFSADSTTSKLVNGSAIETKVYDDVSNPLDLADSSFSADLSGLTTRLGYYARSYMKNSLGSYYYGPKIRFISEYRDFSLVLDGDRDAIIMDKRNTFSHINNWGAAGNTFSLDLWMRKGSASTSKQTLCSNKSGSDGYLIALNNGNITLENHTGTTVQSSLQITDEEWHHIALTYNNGTAHIFIDDSISSSLSISINKPNSKGINCLIGARLSGFSLVEEFEGNIDAMRFWNVALSADQVSELLYDNVQEGAAPNTVEGVGSGNVIPSLSWRSLTASFGFNVKSTVEVSAELPASFNFEDQHQLFEFSFFHNDARLESDVVAFNVLAVGDAKPSPYLPRINWRYNATDSLWLDSDNWGANAYPGEGVEAGVFPDVSISALPNDSIYCKYTIINSSSSRLVIKSTPPQVQVLVDRDATVGSYYVDNSGVALLTVLQRISPSIFGERIENETSESVLIEEGAIEPE